MFRHALPIPECATCSGVGHYPVEDGPTDRYCDCDAGRIRRIVDDDPKMDWDAATKSVRGRSRAEEWDRYDYREGVWTLKAAPS